MIKKRVEHDLLGMREVPDRNYYGSTPYGLWKILALQEFPSTTTRAWYIRWRTSKKTLL